MLLDPKFEVKIKARKVLLEAADCLEEYGWVQGCLHKDGRVCMMGAIAEVNAGCGCDPVSVEVVARLTKVTGGVPPAKWNDDPKRTKAQVVRALRRAAGR